MKNPLVSIIIPVYNGSDYLKESIESALAQTYDNLEIIVVNDGSNDQGRTEEIALSYGKQITYYSKGNGGVSSALNTGIKLMKGEYFSWLSHDDLYYPEKISEQIQLLNKVINSKVIINCNYDVVDESGNLLKSSMRRNKAQNNKYDANEAFEMLFSGGNFNGCALLIPKKAIIDGKFFDEDLAFIQDWKMWVLLSRDNYRFLSVNKPLVKMRVHDNRQTLKIQNLHPVESEDFAFELIDDLAKEIDGNMKEIKIVMMWATRNRYTEVVDYIESLLADSKHYNISKQIEFFASKLYIKSLTAVKKSLRFVLNKIRVK